LAKEARFDFSRIDKVQLDVKQSAFQAGALRWILFNGFLSSTANAEGLMKALQFLELKAP
jgi:hypothetical protein